MDIHETKMYCNKKKKKKGNSNLAKQKWEKKIFGRGKKDSPYRYKK